MKKLLAICLSVTLLGCQPLERTEDPIEASHRVTKLCLEGVIYYKVGHGLAPAIDPNDTTKVLRCET